MAISQSTAAFEKHIRDNEAAIGYSLARGDLSNILAKHSDISSDQMRSVFEAMEKSYQERFSDDKNTELGVGAFA